MEWGNYEKITDDIMVLGNRVILRMNVGLSSYDSNNNRTKFHREIEYYSGKSNCKLVNIKRNFDYYLTIEHITNKDYIRIGISDIIKLRYALDEAFKFFYDPKYENLFTKIQGELRIYKRIDPIIITDLSMEKYLQFEPSVFLNFRGEAERGLRMYLSSAESYCDISINRLNAFKYIIDSINLFESAQLMINYIERPEYGTNLYKFNTDSDNEPETNFEGKDRKLNQPLKKNLSFFDKMNKLE